MDGSLLICYCCRWKKRKRKNFSIVVTERVRREMSDQVFAKKYENKEMTKKGQKQRRKQNTITNRVKDTLKFQRHIHIVNLFSGRVEEQEEARWTSKMKKLPQRSNIQKRESTLCPPSHPPKGITSTFREDYLVLSTSSASMLTPSKVLLTSFKRQNAQLLNLCLSPYISASPFLLICDFKHLWRG